MREPYDTVRIKAVTLFRTAVMRVKRGQRFMVNEQRPCAEQQHRLTSNEQQSMRVKPFNHLHLLSAKQRKQRYFRTSTHTYRHKPPLHRSQKTTFKQLHCQ